MKHANNAQYSEIWIEKWFNTVGASRYIPENPYGVFWQDVDKNILSFYRFTQRHERKAITPFPS